MTTVVQRSGVGLACPPCPTRRPTEYYLAEASSARCRQLGYAEPVQAGHKQRYGRVHLVVFHPLQLPDATETVVLMSACGPELRCVLALLPGRRRMDNLLAMLPNLLIAGAQKSGTSWLHRMLRYHPDVFMTELKELQFFNNPAHLGDPAALAAYEQHFAKAGNARWRGESTPAYFWHRGSRPSSPPQRPVEPADFVAEVLGNELERVLLLLRDPVSRTVSAYHHNNAAGRVLAGQGIFDCPTAMGLVDLSLYSVHWRHWANALGQERLTVYLFDDLAAQPRKFLATVMGDLGLHVAREVLDLARPRRRIHGRKAPDVMPNLPVADIDRLLELCEPEVAWVERHTGRSLPAWRNRDVLVAALADPS